MLIHIILDLVRLYNADDDDKISLPLLHICKYRINEFAIEINRKIE